MILYIITDSKIFRSTEITIRIPKMIRNGLKPEKFDLLFVVVSMISLI